MVVFVRVEVEKDNRNSQGIVKEKQRHTQNIFYLLPEKGLSFIAAMAA